MGKGIINYDAEETNRLLAFIKEILDGGGINLDAPKDGNIYGQKDGEWAKAQEQLESGKNIKTLNGVSVLGEGNIDVAPTIGENGNWYINGLDTGKPAKGKDGADGVSLGEIALVQETGTGSGSENKVMSQAAVTKGFNGIDEKINNRTTEYNVSVNHPTSGTDGTNRYDLTGAIAQVPAELRSSGLTVSFLNESGNTEKWEFGGGSWAVSGFSQVGAGKLTELGNELESNKKQYTQLSNSTGLYNIDNNFPLESGYYTSTTARAAVPSVVRKLGLIITYKVDATTSVTEQFIGSAVSAWTDDTNWGSIGSEGGNKILTWNTDAATTRKQVQLKDRKKLMQISYENDDGVINEQYIGTSFIDSEWIKNKNWKQLTVDNIYNENIPSLAITLDKEGKIIEEISTDGKKKIYIPVIVKDLLVVEGNQNIKGDLVVEGDVEILGNFKLDNLNANKVESEQVDAKTINLSTNTIQIQDSDEFIYAIVDNDGKIILGITSTGKLVSVSLNELELSFKQEANLMKQEVDYLGKITSIMRNCVINVICIGDSVTLGIVVDKQPGVEDNQSVVNVSYPAFLSRISGWKVKNQGRGSWTSKDWWHGEKDSDHEVGFPYNNYKDFDLAIIEFGYNDNGMEDTFSTDVDPYDDYNNYADTKVGCYCKIIEGMLVQNNNILIMLSISPMLEGTTTAKVIQKIADKYSLPILKLYESSYINLNSSELHGKKSDGVNVDNVHFNAIGYAYKAQLIYHFIIKYFSDDIQRANLLMRKRLMVDTVNYPPLTIV